MTTFYVRRGGSEDGGCDHVLETNKNLTTGERDFAKVFGNLTSFESDLLLIASAIFAADRAVPRGEREDIARQICLNIPIVNALHLAPLVPQIEQILYTLSNDSWQITLRQAQGKQSSEEQQTFTLKSGKTLLFSGGLDSLAAAVEFATEGLYLVSHKTHNHHTDNSQRELVNILCNHGIDLPHHQFFVSSRSGGPTELKHAEEHSQRTRSFLFLTLGALVARRAGHEEIVYLAENGQLAIHLPLTSGRIGAFSTHTAHPDVLVEMSNFFHSATGVPFTIINPYVNKTKAEVIEVVVNHVPAALPVSNSCWRSARLPKGVTHCGECIPCYVRRIAIETYLSDPTDYGRDIWAEDVSRLRPDDIGRRNMADLAEFVLQINQFSNEEIMNEWPELYSENFDVDAVIGMYKRFAQEAVSVLKRYPNLTPFLS